MVRPNLFLSHAWEDKKDFVRPLAEALLQEFDVWYDEYVLRPGDSLLEKKFLPDRLSHGESPARVTPVRGLTVSLLQSRKSDAL